MKIHTEKVLGAVSEDMKELIELSSNNINMVNQVGASNVPKEQLGTIDTSKYSTKTSVTDEDELADLDLSQTESYKYENLNYKEYIPKPVNDYSDLFQVEVDGIIIKTQSNNPIKILIQENGEKVIYGNGNYIDNISCTSGDGGIHSITIYNSEVDKIQMLGDTRSTIKLVKTDANNIMTGNKEDRIDILDGSTVTNLNSGAGRDIINIENSTIKNTVDAGSGNDVIYVSNSTINGKIITGSGDDALKIKNYSTVGDIENLSGEDSLSKSEESKVGKINNIENYETIKPTKTTKEVKTVDGAKYNELMEKYNGNYPKFKEYTPAEAKETFGIKGLSTTVKIKEVDGEIVIKYPDNYTDKSGIDASGKNIVVLGAKNLRYALANNAKIIDSSMNIGRDSIEVDNNLEFYNSDIMFTYNWDNIDAKNLTLNNSLIYQNPEHNSNNTPSFRLNSENVTIENNSRVYCDIIDTVYDSITLENLNINDSYVYGKFRHYYYYDQNGKSNSGKTPDFYVQGKVNIINSQVGNITTEVDEKTKKTSISSNFKSGYLNENVTISNSYPLNMDYEEQKQILEDFNKSNPQEFDISNIEYNNTKGAWEIVYNYNNRNIVIQLDGEYARYAHNNPDDKNIMKVNVVNGKLCVEGGVVLSIKVEEKENGLTSYRTLTKKDLGINDYEVADIVRINSYLIDGKTDAEELIKEYPTTTEIGTSGDLYARKPSDTILQNYSTTEQEIIRLEKLEYNKIVSNDKQEDNTYIIDIHGVKVKSTQDTVEYTYNSKTGEVIIKSDNIVSILENNNEYNITLYGENASEVIIEEDDNVKDNVNIVKADSFTKDLATQTYATVLVKRNANGKYTYTTEDGIQIETNGESEAQIARDSNGKLIIKCNDIKSINNYGKDIIIYNSKIDKNIDLQGTGDVIIKSVQMHGVLTSKSDLTVFDSYINQPELYGSSNIFCNTEVYVMKSCNENVKIYMENNSKIIKDIDLKKGSELYCNSGNYDISGVLEPIEGITTPQNALPVSFNAYTDIIDGQECTIVEQTYISLAEGLENGSMITTYTIKDKKTGEIIKYVEDNEKKYTRTIRTDFADDKKSFTEEYINHNTDEEKRNENGNYEVLSRVKIKCKYNKDGYNYTLLDADDNTMTTLITNLQEMDKQTVKLGESENRWAKFRPASDKVESCIEEFNNPPISKENSISALGYLYNEYNKGLNLDASSLYDCIKDMSTSSCEYDACSQMILTVDNHEQSLTSYVGSILQECFKNLERDINNTIINTGCLDGMFAEVYSFVGAENSLESIEDQVKSWLNILANVNNNTKKEDYLAAFKLLTGKDFTYDNAKDIIGKYEILKTVESKDNGAKIIYENANMMGIEIPETLQKIMDIYHDNSQEEYIEDDYKKIADSFRKNFSLDEILEDIKNDGKFDFKFSGDYEDFNTAFQNPKNVKLSDICKFYKMLENDSIYTMREIGKRTNTNTNEICEIFVNSNEFKELRKELKKKLNEAILDTKLYDSLYKSMINEASKNGKTLSEEERKEIKNSVKNEIVDYIIETEDTRGSIETTLKFNNVSNKKVYENKDTWVKDAQGLRKNIETIALTVIGTMVAGPGGVLRAIGSGAVTGTLKMTLEAINQAGKASGNASWSTIYSAYADGFSVGFFSGLSNPIKDKIKEQIENKFWQKLIAAGITNEAKFAYSDVLQPIIESVLNGDSINWEEIGSDFLFDQLLVVLMSTADATIDTALSKYKEDKTELAKKALEKKGLTPEKAGILAKQLRTVSGDKYNKIAGVLDKIARGEGLTVRDETIFSSYIEHLNITDTNGKTILSGLDAFGKILNSRDLSQYTEVFSEAISGTTSEIRALVEYVIQKAGIEAVKSHGTTVVKTVVNDLRDGKEIDEILKDVGEKLLGKEDESIAKGFGGFY